MLGDATITVMDEATITRTLINMRVHLLGYIRLIVCDSHLAEDIFQDVTVLAVRKAKEIENERHLVPWVQKAARFQSLKALRSRSRSPVQFTDATLDLLEQHWQTASASDDKNQMAALEICLQRLSPYAQARGVQVF